MFSLSFVGLKPFSILIGYIDLQATGIISVFTEGYVAVVAKLSSVTVSWGCFHHSLKHTR